MEIDLRSLASDELEGILDFAFQRYFEDSGLFGTVEDCLDRVEELKRIGVDEVACLIDYGIAAGKGDGRAVPAGRSAAARQRRRGAEEDDYSIAGADRPPRGHPSAMHARRWRGCWPMNDERARRRWRGVRHLMLGRRGAAAARWSADLRQATSARRS